VIDITELNAELKNTVKKINNSHAEAYHILKEFYQISSREILSQKSSKVRWRFSKDYL
jgi:hypothetical protein